MHKDIEEIRFSTDMIVRRIREIGKLITQDYKNSKDLLFVGILKGSFVFAADIIRAVDLDCDIDFMEASSYGAGTESRGVVEIKKDVTLPVENRDIIVLEDIVDTGNTLLSVKKLLLAKGARSIKICSLFDKPSRRVVEMDVDYYGFKIGNEFIVGYGLDYAEKYRNLPYVGIHKPEVYENKD